MDMVTKDYLETIEIDKMIKEDKELYDNITIIKEQASEETVNRIMFATITIILGIIKFIMDCRPPKDIEAYRILDNKMTDIISQLVEDNTVKVYLLRANMVNAFNDGTPNIYYTDMLIKKLNITENELIAVCLHEYGHYIGKHIIHMRIIKTSIGIIIPILLREMIKKFPSILTFFIGKIISYMLNTKLEIIIRRPQEYFSDSYAAKKGYGKYFISMLNKAEKYTKEMICKDRSEIDCEFLMNEVSKIDDHPIVKKRIENILRSSKVESIASSGRFELLIRFLDRIRNFFSWRK